MKTEIGSLCDAKITLLLPISHSKAQPPKLLLRADEHLLHFAVAFAEAETRDAH